MCDTMTGRLTAWLSNLAPSGRYSILLCQMRTIYIFFFRFLGLHFVYLLGPAWEAYDAKLPFRFGVFRQVFHLTEKLLFGLFPYSCQDYNNPVKQNKIVDKIEKKNDCIMHAGASHLDMHWGLLCSFKIFGPNDDSCQYGPRHKRGLNQQNLLVNLER